MKTEHIEYHDGGTLLEGYLAYDETLERKLPGVLIAHAWEGRDEAACKVAESLAELGCAGFAMDNYGKGVIGHNNEENMKLMSPLIQDRAMLRKRLLAGLETLKAQPMVDTQKIAAIGYCFGGLCALDIARSGADVKGVVSFHGLFNAPENLPNGKITARVLALHGHDDPMVPPEKVQELEDELTRAGVDWQIHVYGNSRHAFTNPKANDPANGLLYNPVAARRAWATMVDFLHEIFA